MVLPVTADMAITLTSSVVSASKVAFFMLIIDNQVVSEVTFPESVKWINDPDLSTEGRKVIMFGKLPNGDWYANADWEEDV